MNKLRLLFVFWLFTAFFMMNLSVLAQAEPVLYFCERYGRNGEVGVSDRFTTGDLTVIVKCDYVLDLENVTIQFTKYNERSGKFEYYKNFSYVVEPDMRYIFAENDESDLKLDEPGFYRVLLLDDEDRTVASALIEIIRR